MFKLTGQGGRRNAQATPQTPRVHGLMALRANVTAPHPIRPAFVPDTPQQQGFDNSLSRVDEISSS